MKKLIIRKDENCIVAEHLENGKPEQTIVELFGTHILPLPYSESADLSQVATDLLKRNKDYTIEIAE